VQTWLCRLVPLYFGWIVLHATLVATQGEEPVPPDCTPILSIESIYEEAAFEARDYEAVWADDSRGYYRLVESAGTTGGQDIVLIDPAIGATNTLVFAEDLIPPTESSPLGIDGFSFSSDHSKLLIFTNAKRVWRSNDRGDYWVLDRTSLELRRIGAGFPASSLRFAKLSPDGRLVGYVHLGNLWVEELRSGAVRQLTFNGGDRFINGAFDWAYEEEFSLHDGWRWSPDGSAIAFWETDTEGVRKHPLIDYTSALYPEIQWIPYPKTGEVFSAVRVGVLSVNGGETRWLNLPDDPRDHYLHYLEWPEEGEGIVLQQLNRLQNVNRLLLADPVTGEVREVLRETDSAWVDVDRANCWAGEGFRFPWLSEREGWRRLYAVEARTGEVKPLFEDPMDVVELLRFVPASGDLYFLAAPGEPTRLYLYRASIHGGAPSRITPSDEPGTHDYRISPDGRWAIHTRSAFDDPPTIELISLPDHVRRRTLEDNSELREKLRLMELPPVEFFRAPIADGLEADAYCMRPPGFDANRLYPAIVYVYGEPAGQTVRDVWGGSGMLWHRLLAQQGCLVFSFDNRGTPAPKGRAWRKAIYRRVGILAPADQAAALQWTLEQRPYLDPSRIGIWGWSGGGSMTLNALFKYPDLYQAGIAVAAVPNMRLYDCIYQERYMGLPDDNVEGYREGSPHHFADRLEGELLLVHGTGDDNVHYQGAEALIDRLLHHGKHFQMLIYPNRSHGIGEGQHTTVHLREAMLQFWKQHLLCPE